MFKAALKNVLAHKLRMFLTGFSIILGVSFVSGTYIFTDSISSTFDNLFSDVYSGTDLTVRPARDDELGQSTNSFDESVLGVVEAVDGVDKAEPEVNGFAQLLDKEGEPVGGQGPPSLGFSWTNEPALNPLKINEGDGRPPVADDEIVIDKATADLYEFSVGDTVKVLFNGPTETFTLVGIATFGDADSLAGASLSAFELTRAQELFGYGESYSAINITAVDGVSPEELQERVGAVLPEGLEAVTGEQQTSEQLDELNQGLGFINTALLAFAGIAIFVGSFIIQNTFRVIVAQRSKELALLRAIGASKLQVMRLVVYEAFFVSLVSSALGILLGMLISAGVRGLMNALNFSLPDGPLTVEPRTIIVSMSVGVVVTIFAALLPAIRASRISPIEAMRENEANAGSRKSLFIRSSIGVVYAAIGAVLLVLGFNGAFDQPLYLVGGGVALMFIGVAFVAPLLSIPITSILAWPLVVTRGVTARLARDNAKRTPRRTASSAAALMIGVSLVTMLSILATTFKTNITTILDDSFPADLSVFNESIGPAGPGTAGVPTSAENALNDVNEITDVTAFRYAYSSVKVEDQIPFIFAGVDADTMDKTFELRATDEAYARMEAEAGIVIRTTAMEANSWSVEDVITVTFASTGVQELTIVGTFEDPFDSDYLVSTETYLANVEDDTIAILAMNASEGYSTDEAKSATEQALSDYPQLSVQDKGDLFEVAEQQIDQILSLFWALLGFAVIIAVLGITNTLMLSISERTREIGMLRAIGMTRRQTRRMIRYESIIIALFGALLGITMGAFFAWALLQALEGEGISGYNVSFVQLGIYFLLAIVAGIIAAAWPARKAARMDVLKAIYHE